MSKTPFCSQCYKDMTWTDKGWTCEHPAPSATTPLLERHANDDTDTTKSPAQCRTCDKFVYIFTGSELARYVEEAQGE